MNMGAKIVKEELLFSPVTSTGMADYDPHSFIIPEMELAPASF
jgi:hypothetical protein